MRGQRTWLPSTARTLWLLRFSGVAWGQNGEGCIVVGGLNLIAILEEQEHRIFSRALSGLVEYDRLFSFEEFPSRLQRYL